MPSRSPAWQDAFLLALVKRLSREPSTHLNPHCLSQHTLYHAFSELEGEAFRLRFSKAEIKDWLLQIGLLTPIPVEYGTVKPIRRTTFFSLDLAKKDCATPNPIELLQAYQAEGVICYFSAVAFHGLSTQPPTHHHVATLQVPPSQPSPQRPPKPKSSCRSSRVIDPLGTRLFTYAGLPYYETMREKRLVPGVQVRHTGPLSLIRITTLEQTLLDTLHRPLSCGGPAVVFEAWEEGLRKVNEDRIADYLPAMDHLPVVQRLGYMLGQLGYTPHDRLSTVINRYLSHLDPEDPSAYQQLFPGMHYPNLKTPWLVYGP
jgi:hypothetical protein